MLDSSMHSGYTASDVRCLTKHPRREIDVLDIA